MDKPYMIMLPGWSMDKNIWGVFQIRFQFDFK